MLKVLDFLNPWSPTGGKLGRIAGPILVMAVVASQAVPGTPLNLLGMTELGGGAAEPGAELVLGVDLSFSRADQQWWEDRYDDGVRIGAQALWTGLQTPAPACDNLQDMRAAGVAPVGYLSLSDAYYGAVNVDKGYAACPDMWAAYLFVVIDIEMPLTNPQAQIEEAIARVRALGQTPVIYTSWGAWSRYVGSWTPDVPLWNALWDNDPDVDYPGLPFGFTVLVGEQYRGGGDWRGVNVDLDVFDKRLLQQPPLPSPVPTPVSTPSTVTSSLPLIQIEGRPEVYAVVGGWKLHICNPDTFNALGYDWTAIRTIAQGDILSQTPALLCR